MAVKKVIHGDDLLYRFFQDVLASQPELFAAVPQMLITTMGIWLPLDVYRQWPIMLPWVVRDPKCRGNRKDVPDQWSAPDERGYLRDDNSLVKSLPRSMSVHGPKGSHVNGARMGTEFVASHIWREVNHDDLASRIPLLNSFVPNLLWLPGQVSKLTDREGGVVQQTLQAMSYAVYREAPVEPHLQGVVDEAWALIPKPTIAVEPVFLDELNWFEASKSFYATRASRLASVVAALEQLERGDQIAEKVVTTRYAQGLPTLGEEVRMRLLAYLRRFGFA